MQKKTTRKRSKKAEPQNKWRKRFIDGAVILTAAFVIVAFLELGNCTIIYVQPFVVWGIVLTPIAVAVALAVYKKIFYWGTLLWCMVCGFICGVCLLFLSFVIYLGANYLFPSSAPYQHKAIVYGKRISGGSRFRRYNIGLHFDDGRYYQWGGRMVEYESINKGDTCAVTMFKGLWGYEVIKDVKVIGRARGLTYEEWEKRFKELKEKY